MSRTPCSVTRWTAARSRRAVAAVSRGTSATMMLRKNTVPPAPEISR